jgi:hypothetical protein
MALWMDKAVEGLQELPGAGHAEVVHAVEPKVGDATRSTLSELRAEVRRRCIGRGGRP